MTVVDVNAAIVLAVVVVVVVQGVAAGKVPADEEVEEETYKHGKGRHRSHRCRHYSSGYNPTHLRIGKINIWSTRPFFIPYVTKSCAQPPK